MRGLILSEQIACDKEDEKLADKCDTEDKKLAGMFPTRGKL